MAYRYRLLTLPVIVLIMVSSAFAKDGFQEHWYRAAVNHVDSHLWVLLISRDGLRYVRRLDLLSLGLPVPEATPVRHASEIYYPASALDNVALYIDQRDRRIYFVDGNRPEIAKPPSADLLLTVTIDGRRLKKPQYLRYADGKLLLPADTLKALRIKTSPKRRPPVSIQRLAGEYFSLDYRKLALNMVVPPRLLKKSLLEIPRAPTVRATEVKPGEGGQSIPQIAGEHGLSAIIDYDIASGNRSSYGQWHSGIYRAAIGDSATTCRTAFLDSPYQKGLQRLNSLCSFDWPQQMLSLSIGDAVGGGDTVTQPVRYGGIRIGTDFGLQPDFVTLPVSQISGTARVPSTLEIWIDQMLALRTKVPAGPFEVRDIPLHTGAGELQATIISPTGASHVITSPFYADASLLASGLSDWSVNLGKLRPDFTTTDRYTDAFAAGSIRYGLAGGLTGDFGFQATRKFRLVSAGLAMRLGYFAVLDVGGGHSTSRMGGSGSALRARLTHQGPYLSVSYQWQHNSRGYQELAWPTPGSAPQSTQQLSLGLPIGGGASFSVGDYSRHYFDGTSIRFQSASLSLRLGSWGYLLLSGFHLADGDAPWSYAAQLTVPFGTRSNVSAWAQTDHNVQSERFGIQTNPPAGPGFGYRLGIENTGAVRSGDFDVQLQGESAELDLAASDFAGQKSAQARVAGSVLLSADGLDLSRHKPGSYAVIHVGVPDIPVYRDGQLAAYSGGDGDAVVAGLLPYDNNVISIQPGDVPINIQPRALQSVLIPGRREIMSASFDFERVRYLTGRLKTLKYGFVPPGATLSISGVQAKTVVGDGGRFFINAPGEGKVNLEASWGDKACRALVKVKAKDQATTVTELGNLPCRMVHQ
ncbi:MAG TPA: fimbria/pilus outer membrane usher protein [Gammaproteobacteria bacterium]|nr:fimbria/pilus outer membrane usher protein [Gammaproteobacteria bacterium]